ncbi:tRNA-i(6)A37 methylthiotransferase [Erysipelotrichaceae bacterium]|nr:tRNA-i(6)A37 methylthiotransferase [Erysipelotrichaceae bacterium]
MSEKRTKKRTVATFGKYFTAPSLKDARKRRKDEDSEIIRDSFEVPEDMVNAGIGRKYYIRTYGCQMNEHDTEVMAGIFELLGYEKTELTAEADIILLNTCAVRDTAENKVFGELGHLKYLKASRPDLLLGVCGCMSQEEEVVDTILRKHQHVDMIFGTHNIHRLPQLIKEAYMNKEMVVEVWSQEGDIIENLPKTRLGDLKAWVNITYGCDKFCTYCIIPYTRGKERSRLPEDILAEVEELAQKGYQEITLLGQNVNSYGNDLNGGVYGFANLLEAVQKIAIPRVRFTTSHPWEFTDEMIKIISKGGNMMPHVHLPVQSGSSAILRKMGRLYTREEYLTLYNKIRKNIPNVSITTDIIVGFPNETAEQFEETASLVEQCAFDGAYTFIYSQRDGTPAAKLNDNVPIQEKKQRLQTLNALVNEAALKRNGHFLGEVVEVLVHGESKKNAAVLSGYTPQNKLVNFVGGKDLIGKRLEVKVIQVKNWTLDGEVHNG